MLENGVLDPDESVELLSILHKINGEPSEVVELEKTTSLPIDHPLPSLTFEGMEFLFTVLIAESVASLWIDCVP